MQMKIRKSFILLFSAVIAALLALAGAFMLAPKTTAYADTEGESTDVAQVTFGEGGSATSLSLEGAWYVANSHPSATVTLLADVQTTGTLAVQGGKDITLELNGHTVTGDGTGSVISVHQDAMFTLCDSAGTGCITGGNAIDGGGVFVNGGTFTMNGGIISGNTVSSRGGGVFVNADCTFTMNGGEIKNNTASEGGGVFVISNTTFEMTGGTISGNSAADGSGVYIGGYFKMTGGTISGNTASNNGGVYIYLPLVALPSIGGGGGIAKQGFDISGAPVITGNKLTDGSSNNVYIANAKAARVVGELTEGAQIGVNNTGVVATGYKYNGSDKPSKYFIPDNPDFNCVYVSDETSGTVSIGHDWDEGTVTTQPTCTDGGEKTFTCSVCGETKTEPVEALGHTEVSDDNAVAPTCTETGLTASTHCSVCNTVVSEQTTVTALGHSYGEWTVTKEATEAEEGEERRICANDNTHYETRTIPKLTPSTPTPTPEKPSAPAEETKSYWWLFWLLIPLAIGVGGVTLGIWVYKNDKKNNRL